MVANPFHSEKVKAEIALSVARPGDFPMKLVAMGILFKMTITRFRVSSPNGKGRGSLGEKEVSLGAPAMGSQSLDGLQRALEVEL